MLWINGWKICIDKFIVLIVWILIEKYIIDYMFVYVYFENLLDI